MNIWRIFYNKNVDVLYDNYRRVNLYGLKEGHWSQKFPSLTKSRSKWSKEGQSKIQWENANVVENAEVETYTKAKALCMIDYLLQNLVYINQFYLALTLKLFIHGVLKYMF
jgi:hypothetical protein